jgi:hypothetical protein
MLAIMSLHRGAHRAAADAAARARPSSRCARARPRPLTGTIRARSRRWPTRSTSCCARTRRSSSAPSNQVGNLAHGLKTPIAVLRNEATAAKDNPLSRIVSTSETDKMQQIVTTYLDRARISARSAVVGKKADGIHVMLRLVRVMEKLNPAGHLSPWCGRTPRCPGSGATRAISRRWRATCSTMPANGPRADRRHHGRRAQQVARPCC